MSFYFIYIVREWVLIKCIRNSFQIESKISLEKNFSKWKLFLYIRKWIQKSISFEEVISKLVDYENQNDFLEII